MHNELFVTPTDGMGLEGCIAQTASGGIPARSGAVAGKAEDVAMQQIGTDGTLVATGSNMTVYNPFGTAVRGSVYILCKRVDGVWIVDAEDCS
jgi:hypothetical protein